MPTLNVLHLWIMSHTSPAVNLVWALLTCLLGSFLLFHLWSFDGFKCLRWNNGPHSGAFKRVMTYSYLLSVPLVMTYALGFAIIKYNEGFVFIPGIGVVSKPFQMWGSNARMAIFPLYLAFSVGWSFEMVTHLEELCFWFFLVNAGSAQQDWFRSLYFKIWLIGSVVAICYMPLVTTFTRSDLLKCEAYTFLAGSLGSLCLTLWFTPILWVFPHFLGTLRREGVDKGTVVRLTKFHELNTVRVLFRFLFVCPLVTLGIDGIRPHQHINENMMWTDLLAIIAALGCVVSSGITLVIFFPRSIEGEMAARDAARERRSTPPPSHQDHISRSQVNRDGTYLLTDSPVKHALSLPNRSSLDGISPVSVGKVWLHDHISDSRALSVLPIPGRPNQRPDSGDVEMALGERLHGQPAVMNHLVYSFLSPIDLASSPYPLQNASVDTTE